MHDGSLPTGVWLEARLHTLTLNATHYYVIQKGNHASGVVMLKLNGLKGQVKLLVQQRDFMTDTLEWVNAMDEEMVEEPAADAFIETSKNRDPDLWVIEIEDENMHNPFVE